jgi:hypothetical protein
MTETKSTYSFLSWARRGISNNITAIPAGKPRAEVTVKLTLNGTDIPNTIQLIGPGDIVGINSNEIVRTEPLNWITDFAPNYLPFIEFYDEDFPWRYSPALAGNQPRLSPWLHLLVLKEEEYERTTMASRPLASLKLLANPADVFPAPAQTWAWAHVHVNSPLPANGTAPDNAILNTRIKDNPDIAFSRLFGSRKLKEKTAYYAFLVPAFESGRLAGLGEEVPKDMDALAPAWTREEAPGKEYPVYYEWYFRTGAKGDFEYLVGLLKPRVMDARIGTRDMDVHAPGFGLGDLSDQAIVGLEGALRAPATQSKGFADPNDKTKFEQQLEAVINLQADLKIEGNAKEPVISPPLYGQWHALVARLSLDPAAENWVNGLNKRPRHRSVAGLGTRVIRTNQEKFMATAWEEAGEILAANQKIRYAQMAMKVSERMYAKYLSKLNKDSFLQATSLVHKKILFPPATIYKNIKDSKIPYASLSCSFRRFIRPMGNAMQNFNRRIQSKQQISIVEQLNTGSITAAKLKKTPKGILTYKKIIEKIKTVSADKSPKVRAKIEEAVNLLSAGFTQEALGKIPLNPTFFIGQPATDPENPPPSGDADSVEAARFREALQGFIGYLSQSTIEYEENLPLDIDNTIAKIKNALGPATAFPKRILGTIVVGNKPLDAIVPVMAFPDIKQPMYEPLRNISAELLIPNLGLIPQNTISLLETNQPFIEAYMVGLNHEFARELLWREYPTDQRGSYFRQFWDVSRFIDTKGLPEEKLAEALKDITSIHTWPVDSKLGEHENREHDNLNTDRKPARLVLVIRGDLLKKYPNTVIFAQKAVWATDKPQLVVDKSGGEGLNDLNILYPAFSAEVNPDLTFLGFNFSTEDAKGEVQSETQAEKDRLGNNTNLGWFFILQEVVGGPSFGLDVRGSANPPQVENWDDLTWGHLGTDIKCIDVDKLPENTSVPGPVQWGANSADMAYILYQKPMMVAVHAREMLKS